MTGRVVRILHDKGFGFIQGDDGARREYFFHRTACDATTPFDRLQEGAVVTFEEAEPSPKGPRAEHVDLA